MNMQQPQPISQGREPAPPPPPRRTMEAKLKYRMPQNVAFYDEVGYHACFHLVYSANHACKNNCDKCLYHSGYKVCVKDIALEIKRNIERKYGVCDEGGNDDQK